MVPILVMIFAGVACGALLFVASKYFYVQKDENIERISDYLGGANCGGCGYASCTELAKAVANGTELPNACPSLASEQLQEIENILGVSGTEAQTKKAYIACNGTQCAIKYEYEGVEDCMSVAMINGGNKQCVSACVGYGNCVRSCKFDALKIIDGIAIVDPEKCVGCSVCVSTCPKNLIKINSSNTAHYVACSSTMKGGEKRKICPTACIGCTLCQKKCPTGAITITNFVATISHDLCTDCGECLAHCPTKAIKA